MLFFYKSHTPIFSYTGHFKKIYNAVKCAIPTPILKKGVQWKKYLKNKTNEYLNTLRELGITNEEVMDYLREKMK